MSYLCLKLQVVMIIFCRTLILLPKRLFMTAFAVLNMRRVKY